MFISPDSIVSDWYNPQSLNRYAYCLNNPLIYNDPTGHQPRINPDGSINTMQCHAGDLEDNMMVDQTVQYWINGPSIYPPDHFVDYHPIVTGFHNYMLDLSMMSADEKVGLLGQTALTFLIPEVRAAEMTADLAAMSIPQGLVRSQFQEVSSLLRTVAGHLGDDIAVHGSRASYTATATSDIDFAIRVTAEQFESLIQTRFGTPNPGSAKLRTMLHAIETGKIQAGEAGLSGLRRLLQDQLGMKVDISVIKIGGTFDQGPYISIP